MTERRVDDPYPGYGGRSLPPMLSVGVALLVISVGIGALAFGSSSGGFEEVDKLASIKCLGCLGLDPVVPGFIEFWVQYPEKHVKEGQNVTHPQEVYNILDDGNVDLLILFFWTQGCVPCAAQWEEMTEKKIASGEEDGGSEGEKYAYLKIISIDAANDPVGYYSTYIPTGNENGVPMTTFIFEDSDGIITWYSHYGRMEIGPLESLITHVLYDEISSAD